MADRPLSNPEGEDLDFIAETLFRIEDAAGGVRVIWGPLHTIISAKLATEVGRELMSSGLHAARDGKMAAALAEKGWGLAEIQEMVTVIADWHVG